MPSVSELFFGSEDLARQISELDTDLHQAIEEIKKLKEDWQQW